MSSLEMRSNSALFKRADQLRRWEESDTNREPVAPKQRLRKIKFSSGCVFLAACAAAEKDEVIKLLDQGADIDTANVDGLTALHQACIDDNLDMVEFLVERGADVNRGDNEGWTPLHATASCGFLSIAKYLLEQGGNVAAVNCDGELALDITESEQMRALLQGEIDGQGIDCDLVRNEEKRLMLHDAMNWFKSKSACVNDCSPNTGATPLHVACAKGYIDVIKVLLQCVDVDIDKQDVDGWTPLHAAAHWGQREASQLLTEHLADMDFKNYVGQTAFDVAASDIYNHLEELSKAQNHEAVLVRRRRKQGLSKKRQDSVGSEEAETAETPTKVQRLEEQTNADKQTDGMILNNAEVIGLMEVSDQGESETDSETETDSSVDSDHSESEIDVDINEKKNRANVQSNQNIDSLSKTTHIDKSSEKTATKTAIVQSPTEETKSIGVKADDAIITNKTKEKDVNEKDNKVEKDVKEGQQGHGLKPSKSFNSKDRDGIEVKLRKNYSFQNDPLFCERYREVRARIQATSSLPNAVYGAQLRAPTSNYIIPPSATTTPSVGTSPVHPTDEQIQTRQSPLRRHSNPIGRESDQQQQRSDGININLSAQALESGVDDVQRQRSPTSPSHQSVTSPATSPPPSNPSMKISGVKVPINMALPQTQNGSQNGDAANSANIGINRLTMIKNFFKSFVPPVRDEESETQRKARAKKVRETRRSTQGVTLEEIKSAEQLVKNNQINNNNNDNPSSVGTNDICITATITQFTTAAPTVANATTTSSSRHGSVVSLSSDASDLTQSSTTTANVSTQERRPSWRLRLDNGSKFKLEDAATAPDQQQPTSPTSDTLPTLSSSQTPNSTANTPSFIRRTQQTTTTAGNTGIVRPNSAPVQVDGTNSVAATGATAVTTEATVTLPLRSRVGVGAGTSAGGAAKATSTSLQGDDKEQDKENDARNAHQASIPMQAAIQRRRRSKRRSTGGVVQFEGLEQELEADKDGTGGGDCVPEDSTKLNHQTEPLAPSRRRSSSGVRSSATTNGSAATYNRSSRSYTGSVTSPYGSSLTGSGGGYSSSGYNSPYYPNTYRSSQSGTYSASLSIPAKSLVSGLSTNPSYARKYESGRYCSTAGAGGGGSSERRSRDLGRSGSYRMSTGDGVKSSHSRSRSAGLAASAMGSRSTSLTSLNSEGYVSGTERSVGSRSSSRSDLTSMTARCENGDIDYKRMYEQAVVDNDRLKDKLRKNDEELRDTKQTLERLNTVTSKNSLSELEKRERRAMERKLSEMEEELKQLQKLKAENERLRAENRALTRVVSKLSNSVTK